MEYELSDGSQAILPDIELLALERYRVLELPADEPPDPKRQKQDQALQKVMQQANWLERGKKLLQKKGAGNP